MPGGGVFEAIGVLIVPSNGNSLVCAWYGGFDLALPKRLSKTRSWKMPKPPRIAVLPRPPDHTRSRPRLNQLPAIPVQLPAGARPTEVKAKPWGAPPRSLAVEIREVAIRSYGTPLKS